MTHHTKHHTPFADAARWAGAAEHDICMADRPSTARLLVSGRLASGKDTVAEAAMRSLGLSHAVRVSFATALRAEVDELFTAGAHLSGAQLANEIRRMADVDTATAESISAQVASILTHNPQASSYDRTGDIRLLLQVWGTDVRRANDPSYWSKQGVRTIVEHLAQGRPTYITDARFIDEVEVAKQLGFLTIRLEVPADIRADRLWARDQLGLDPAAETHQSETELEQYQQFDLRVDNSYDLSMSVGVVRDALVARFGDI